MHVTLQGCADAFLNGMGIAVPTGLLKALWRPQDLRRMVCGPQIIDVNTIREGATYTGVSVEYAVLCPVLWISGGDVNSFCCHGFAYLPDSW
jgi:hypothetical protein